MPTRSSTASTARAQPGSIVPAALSSDVAISQALGQRIKALRARSGLTLEQLSRQSGVSRAMLSTIERGEKSPTLPIIVRIAAGFGISLSRLLGAEPDPSSVAVVRAEQRIAFRDPETGFERWMLSPAHVDNGVEFVLHRLPAGRSTGMLPASARPTEKYLTVASGTLTVVVDGQRQVLNTGDAIYFEVHAPYCFVNEDPRTDCTYYMVIARKR
ncbi:MAG: XRE family transcriptional regulator [Burkholderiaceae bacterium]|nr:XRE family transcriptional regulator [Burkholderiaceae bacterium]